MYCETDPRSAETFVYRCAFVYHSNPNRSCTLRPIAFRVLLPGNLYPSHPPSMGPCWVVQRYVPFAKFWVLGGGGLRKTFGSYWVLNVCGHQAKTILSSQVIVNLTVGFGGISSSFVSRIFLSNPNPNFFNQMDLYFLSCF